MAAKPLTSEAIALTEKKMDMALDDIIKMSKNSSSKPNKQRVLNKSQKVFNGGSIQRNSTKARQFLDSKSSLRQGVLGQRRSNFQDNQFPVATEVARKAAAAPIRNRTFNSYRMANNNSNRVGVPPVQRQVIGGGVVGKSQRVTMAPKQKPHTLDALFANMKEERMKVLSPRSDVQSGEGAQQQLRNGRYRSGNMTGRPRSAPWIRRYQFGNLSGRRHGFSFAKRM